MLLEDKVAVIYGAGGAVGGTVARAFAREGARVFLAGRTLATLKAVADDVSFNGRAELAEVDALDAGSVASHAEDVVAGAGRIDVSFNAIGLGDAQGAPLLEMAQEDFSQPVATAVRTQFLTATAAARYMARSGSGVVLAITAGVGRDPVPNIGGFGVACAAIEGICRHLAVELGPKGIRVVCLRSAGSPDAPGVDEAFRIHASSAGISRETFEDGLAERTSLKRLPLLHEVANAAVIMASDRASAITGTVLNVTCGEND